MQLQVLQEVDGEYGHELATELSMGVCFSSASSCTILTADGVPGGGLISGPEYGAIFRYWSWIFPAFRQTARSACTACEPFDEHFDNGRFHKAYTYVRPENEVALALLRRYGYAETGVCSRATSSARTTA